MAPLFASADIADLVDDFPPYPPTKAQPSFVRSLSGSNLFDSRKVQSRFRTLLETATSRIKISDLPYRLSVQDVDWLLECSEETLFRGADRDFLVPVPEQDHLRESLKVQALHTLVSINELATSNRLSKSSVELLIRSLNSSVPPFRLSYFSNGHIYSEQYAHTIMDTIRNVISSSSKSEVLDLSAQPLFCELPAPFIQRFADEITILEPAKFSGTIEMQGPRVVFVPADYVTSLERQQRKLYDDQIEQLVQRIEQTGYCIIPSHLDGGPEKTSQIAVQWDVTSKYHEDRPQSRELVLVDEPTAQTMLYKPAALGTTLNAITTSSKQHLQQLWQSRDGSQKETALIDNALKSSAESSETPEEWTALTSSPTHSASIRQVLKSSLEALEQADVTVYQDLSQQNLLADIHLYTTGVATIIDATLKRNLEDYLAEEFCRYAIPEFIKLLREKHLLVNRARARDVEKFQQSTTEAKTFTEIVAAASKLAKKHKIPAPSPSNLRTRKIETLRQKLKLVHKSTTGSFILQNLTWILLSQVSTEEALFMSAGKDTTRMIKQFQAVGGGETQTETGKELMQRRDILKKGEESRDVLQEMRELAESIVIGVCERAEQM